MEEYINSQLDDEMMTGVEGQEDGLVEQGVAASGVEGETRPSRSRHHVGYSYQRLQQAKHPRLGAFMTGSTPCLLEAVWDERSPLLC